MVSSNPEPFGEQFNVRKDFSDLIFLNVFREQIRDLYSNAYIVETWLMSILKLILNSYKDYIITWAIQISGCFLFHYGRNPSSSGLSFNYNPVNLYQPTWQ